MKTLLKFVSVFLMILVVTPSYADDGDMTFSHDNGSSTSVNWGTKIREHYDVAISLEKICSMAQFSKGLKFLLTVPTK